MKQPRKIWATKIDGEFDLDSWGTPFLWPTKGEAKSYGEPVHVEIKEVKKKK